MRDPVAAYSSAFVPASSLLSPRCNTSANQSSKELRIVYSAKSYFRGLSGGPGSSRQFLRDRQRLGLGDQAAFLTSRIIRYH